MASLTGHARKKWRADGYIVEQAEHISRAGKFTRRHDTFGFTDLICVKAGSLIFLQVTSWGNVSARCNKIARENHGSGQHARPMIEIAKNLMSIHGVRIVVEGWKLDKKANRWVSREVEITAAELDRRRGI